ncbi:MAG TPA: hypothetical protein VF490_13615 [Chryseosolibacter sp.]
MKKLVTTLAFLMLNVPVLLACEVCRKNQPKVLQTITHGAGPTGTLDYIITWSAVALVTVTLVLSLKFLVRPGETGSDHIKNVVLNPNR